MDHTPKSKFFGFKKNGRSSEPSSPSNNRSISVNEVIDLENLPISQNAIPTSPAVSRINPANQLCIGQSSPGFVVGWNDGAGSDDLDMCSPIRAVPVLRNIRRCPDSYTFKAPKKKSRDCKEDILQCIDWSKNLFDTTSLEEEVSPDEEKKNSLKEENKTSVDTETNVSQVPKADNKVTESRNETKNIIDILDDSADEEMILCSQAVEQSLPLSRHPPAPVSANIPKKHSITPEEPSSKRLRIDTSSNIKGHSKADSTAVNVNNNVRKCDPSNFKVPSNNQSNSKPLNPVGPSKVGSKVPNSSMPKQNDFESLMNEDEDELLGAFDFHSIDKKAPPTPNKGVPSKSMSSHASIGAPKSNDNRNATTKPIHKYTKEQIEQRRLEAKKRLLFNKKYKSV